MTIALFPRSEALSRLIRLNAFEAAHWQTAFSVSTDQSSLTEQFTKCIQTFSQCHRKERETLIKKFSTTIPLREACQVIAKQRAKLVRVVLGQIEAGKWDDHLKKVPAEVLRTHLMPFLKPTERSSFLEIYIPSYMGPHAVSRWEKLKQIRINNLRLFNMQLFQQLHSSDRAKLETVLNECTEGVHKTFFDFFMATGQAHKPIESWNELGKWQARYQERATVHRFFDSFKIRIKEPFQTVELELAFDTVSDREFHLFKKLSETLFQKHVAPLLMPADLYALKKVSKTFVEKSQLSSSLLQQRQMHISHLQEADEKLIRAYMRDIRTYLVEVTPSMEASICTFCEEERAEVLP